MNIAITPVISARRPKRKMQVGGLLICAVSAVFVLVVLLAKWLTPYSPTDILATARLGPSFQHLLGTDQLGRDVFSRMLFGGQQTLLMAAASTVIAAAIGVPLGIFAGYVGKWRATVTMRLMDILLAFPGLLLALIIITIGGAGIGTTILAVGVSFIPVFARVVYGTTQRIRAEEYIAAAQVVGCSTLRIMVRHVIPVVMTEVLVLVSSAIGWTALLCASLNFLGFGVAPPTAEWGADLGAGSKYIGQAWWISAAPGIAITITILLANFLGDYFAKVLDAQPAAIPSVPSISTPSI
jgi:peptide/nickel transport system permease protein